MGEFNKLAEQKGLLPDNYAPQWGDNQLSVDHQNFLERNGALIAAGAAALPFVPSLLGLGGAAAGGSAAGSTAPLATATAGSSFASKIPTLLKDVAPVVSSLASGRAAGRAAEDEANLRSDELGISRARVAQDDYQRNVQNAIRGGLLANIQDANIAPPHGVEMGTVTGGLRPSSIRNKDSLGIGIQDSATRNLLGMDEAGDTRTPAVTPRPSAGGFDKALGAIAPALSITELLTSNMAKPAVQPTTGTTFRNTGMNGVRLLPPPRY